MNVNGTPYRTVWMDNNIVYLINQPKLPHHFEVLPHHDTESVAVAIETMVVRGAGAIGATGAFGLAQAAQLASEDDFWTDVDSAKHRLAHTRPTAQNLFYGLTKVYEAMKATSTIAEARSAALTAAQGVADEDAEACKQIGIHGAERITEGMRISTHCNAGWLAFVDWGSAISPFRVRR
jgi:methylthioribose-1-phosphate isomerase